MHKTYTLYILPIFSDARGKKVDSPLVLGRNNRGLAETEAVNKEDQEESAEADTIETIEQGSWLTLFLFLQA